LDVKNIKNSLNFIARYITNKQVDSSKLNDLKDFNGIGEAIWNFISSVYQSNWDSLYTDKQSNLLRRKIATKFTPRTICLLAKIIRKPTSILQQTIIEFLHPFLLNPRKKSMLF